MPTMHIMNIFRVYLLVPSSRPIVGASAAVDMATRLVQRLKVVLDMPISCTTGDMNRLKQVCIIEWSSAITMKPPITTNHGLKFLWIFLILSPPRQIRPHPHTRRLYLRPTVFLEILPAKQACTPPQIAVIVAALGGDIGAHLAVLRL